MTTEHQGDDKVEAATVPESKTIFLINETGEDHVIGDIDPPVVFAAHGATYDQYMRAVPRATVEASMGIQMLLADGKLREIEKDELQGKLRDRSAANSAARTDKAVEFEGDESEEITPQEILDANAKQPTSDAAKLDQVQSDDSQLAPDIGSDG